jgi:hypothetical protein
MELLSGILSELSWTRGAATWWNDLDDGLLSRDASTGSKEHCTRLGGE